MRKIITIVAALCFAGLGASDGRACELMSFAYHYWWHQDRPERYVVVQGAFQEMRFVRHDRTADQAIWEARFVGFGASSRAFDRPFTAEVTVTHQLASEFEPQDPRSLGPAVEGVSGLVFLEETAEGYRAEMRYCDTLVHTEPEDVTVALDCLAGRRCPRH